MARASRPTGGRRRRRILRPSVERLSALANTGRLRSGRCEIFVGATATARRRGRRRRGEPRRDVEMPSRPLRRRPAGSSAGSVRWWRLRSRSGEAWRAGLSVSPERSRRTRTARRASAVSCRARVSARDAGRAPVGRRGGNSRSRTGSTCPGAGSGVVDQRALEAVPAEVRPRPGRHWRGRSRARRGGYARRRRWSDHRWLSRRRSAGDCAARTTRSRGARPRRLTKGLPAGPIAGRRAGARVDAEELAPHPYSLSSPFLLPLSINVQEAIGTELDLTSIVVPASNGKGDSCGLASEPQLRIHAVGSV